MLQAMHACIIIYGPAYPCIPTTKVHEIQSQDFSHNFNVNWSVSHCFSSAMITGSAGSMRTHDHFLELIFFITIPEHTLTIKTKQHT